MIEKGAEALADWLIRCNAVKETDKELYRYAAYSFFLTISPLLLSAVLGFCTGCLKQSIVIIIPFMLIRKFSGGYHTKHLWTCLLCSSLLMLLSIILSLVVVCDWRLFTVTVAAGISLIIFSPLEHENRVLEQNEKRCYKIITAVFVVLLILVGIILYFVELHVYASCIFIGVILSAGMQFPNILKRGFKAI